MAVTYELQAAHATRDAEDQLCVEREGIAFYNVREDLVRIEVSVSNRGFDRSRRVPVQLQAAPLGAFLPWRDVATLWVPPLYGGEEVTVTTEVSCPRTQPLGHFDRVPPARLLTALGMSDDDRQNSESNPASRTIGRVLRRQNRSRLTGAQPAANAQLPLDLMALIGQPGTHWAGNINVLVGKTPVERHMAQALRIYPGRLNHAMLVVGDGRRDAYSFQLRGEGAAWQAQLSAFVMVQADGRAQPFTSIDLGQWYDVRGMVVLQLTIQPPAVAERGEVAVQVSRRSTGQTALVEFSLDATAQGPGCYAV